MQMPGRAFLGELFRGQKRPLSREEQENFLNHVFRFYHLSPSEEQTTWRLLNHVPKIIGLHPFPIIEQGIMIAAVSAVRPDVVIDIGTHLGKSARLFFEAARAFSLQPAIYTIDLLDPHHIEYPGRKYATFVRDIRTVQKVVGVSWQEVPKIIHRHSARAKILVFIDGDHAYDSVKKDVASCSGMRAGALLFHDIKANFFENRGPRQAFNDTLKRNRLVVRSFVWDQMYPGMAVITFQAKANMEYNGA